MEELNKILAGLVGYDMLTPEMKQSALNRSLVPDSAGVWPGRPGYVDSYDVYFAALLLIPILAAQPVVTSASSEGTSASVRATDWGQLAASYRGLSPIVQATSSSVLNILPIPDVPHVRRVPMNDRGGYYGDVDTDIG